MSRRRAVATAVAIFFLASCSSEVRVEPVDEEVASRLAAFDPAEVQKVRDSYEKDGWAFDDGNVLDVLVMEQECRDIRSGLASLDSGAAAGGLADHFDVVLVEDNLSRQPEIAEYFQRVVSELRAGDPTNLREYLELNCESVT